MNLIEAFLDTDHPLEHFTSGVDIQDTESVESAVEALEAQMWRNNFSSVK